MRFLFVGDVYGKPGREAIYALVPKLREQHQLDAVVVNAENAAGGSGITPEVVDQMLACGVDVVTGGNHSWQYKEIRPYIAQQPRLIRPANHRDVPGLGAYVLTLADGRKLGVVQVEGQVFMRPHADPFDTLDKELAALGETQAILVDVHAEATSEKQAIAYYLNGRVSAVIGTHTHVQTADERILSRGTALLSDAGMTGPYDSVIGMDPKVAMARFLRRGKPERRVASGDVRLCGAIVTTDDQTGWATAIERVQVPFEMPAKAASAS